jgi:hypothetical protein
MSVNGLGLLLYKVVTKCHQRSLEGCYHITQMEDVREMTIHRLTVTVTIVETTTIRIIPSEESTDEGPIDLAVHSAVDRAGCRTPWRQRSAFARAGHGHESTADGGTSRGTACD